MTVRMRTIPTEAERTAHYPLPWLCRDEYGNPRTGYWTKDGAFECVGRGILLERRVAAWTFWPCDENLNKVETLGFSFADCTPPTETKPPIVGDVWKEKGGRKRTARIDELHTVGFSETARAVLTVLTAEGPGTFKRNLRLCRVVFERTWGFLRVS